jgi:hypothetical protein
MAQHAVWLAGAFVVAFLAVGIPYWQVPYAKVSLPGTLMGAGLVVVVVAAALVRAAGKCHIVLSLLAAGLAVPSVVVARVAVDTIHDPTSHNLWPFEVIIASVVGLLASSAGALLGSVPGVMARLRAR